MADKKQVEHIKDSKIKKISLRSRHVVLDKTMGLPIFLDAENVPEEIPVRIVYKKGEIVIHRKEG